MQKYSTQSLYEASYLLSKGFKLASRLSNGQKTSLVFENTSAVQEAVMDFYNSSGSAAPKVLFDQFRSLKDMVFQR